MVQSQNITNKQIKDFSENWMRTILSNIFLIQSLAKILLRLLKKENEKENDAVMLKLKYLLELMSINVRFVINEK